MGTDSSHHHDPARPPADAFGDESIRGTRCQPQHDSSGMTPPTHTGCPGWWLGFEDDDSVGFVCTCDCHEDYAGWPGWVANVNRI